MDMFTLAVAGVAALAVILIAFGIASSGSSGCAPRNWLRNSSSTTATLALASPTT